MLVDHRTYRIKPTHMNTHLAIYEEFGLKAQWRHLGEPNAYMFAESGAMNSYFDGRFGTAKNRVDLVIP